MKICVPIVNFISVGYLEFNTATIFVFAYPYLHCISMLIIHQIILLVRDWSKNVTGPNIFLLKLGNIRDY